MTLKQPSSGPLTINLTILLTGMWAWRLHPYSSHHRPVDLASPAPPIICKKLSENNEIYLLNAKMMRSFFFNRISHNRFCKTTCTLSTMEDILLSPHHLNSKAPTLKMTNIYCGCFTFKLVCYGTKWSSVNRSSLLHCPNAQQFCVTVPEE